MGNQKSVWDDLSKIWKRVAAVLTAIGILATAIVKIFNTPPEFTYVIFICIGGVLLIVSFYVDKQAQYNHEEILNSEKKAREDFFKVMKEGEKKTLGLKKDSDEKIDKLTNLLYQLLDLSEDTRRDTVRIQLIMIMHHEPENVDSILKLAKKYFVELHGDWYMTSEFTKWANSHDVIIPEYITKAIVETHEKNENTGKYN